MFDTTQNLTALCLEHHTLYSAVSGTPQSLIPLCPTYCVGHTVPCSLYRIWIYEILRIDIVDRWRRVRCARYPAGATPQRTPSFHRTSSERSSSILCISLLKDVLNILHFSRKHNLKRQCRENFLYFFHESIKLTCWLLIIMIKRFCKWLRFHGYVFKMKNSVLCYTARSCNPRWVPQRGVIDY